MSIICAAMCPRGEWNMSQEQFGMGSARLMEQVVHQMVACTFTPGILQQELLYPPGQRISQ